MAGRHSWLLSLLAPPQPQRDLSNCVGAGSGEGGKGGSESMQEGKGSTYSTAFYFQ